MEPRRNQEYDERQMRRSLSEGYRWLWVGLIYTCVILATVMKGCFGY
ncbi:hypothetical protein LCGC14_1947480 [marine sediment metagenome]|uniref:Uncharacterized protein n=1 Tax=marine sediment metagenome TaxID=412755 RepID=A0A0F9FIR0_9ZZZZ